MANRNNTRHSNYREDLSDTPEWMKKKKCPHRAKYLSGKRILPKNLTGKETLPDLVDEVFLAYNSARLKEGCQLFNDKMLAADVTIGMTISGALTPAGLGCSCIVPLIKAGVVGLIGFISAKLLHGIINSAMHDQPGAADGGSTVN